jgi:hypothetical protein
LDFRLLDLIARDCRKSLWGWSRQRQTKIPKARYKIIIVGIDGGCLRNWCDKQKKFEVIVGKFMADDRDDRSFGLVRSSDDAPARRLGEVLRRQGLPVDQAVTAMTAGGDSVRALVSARPAGTEHYLDRCPLAMRLTGLGQRCSGSALAVAA